MGAVTPKSPSQPCGVATHHPTGQPGELKMDWHPYLPGSCAGRCPWPQCSGLWSASEFPRPTTTDLMGLRVQAQQDIRPGLRGPLGPGCTQPCTWRWVLHGRSIVWARRHPRPPCHWAVQPWTRTRFSEPSAPWDLSIPGPADSSQGLQPSRQDQGGAEGEQLGFLMPAVSRWYCGSYCGSYYGTTVTLSRTETPIPRSQTREPVFQDRGTALPS